MFYETNTFPHWVFSQFLEDWNMQKLRTKESRHIKNIYNRNNKLKMQDLWNPLWHFHSAPCHLQVLLVVGAFCFIKSRINTEPTRSFICYVKRLISFLSLCLTRQPFHLTWTPQSSRLYLCYQELCGKNTWPRNTDKLRAAIKATWASASRQLCCRLTVSMPRCNHAVIYGKEAPARCWGYKWAAWDTEVNELWAKIIEIKAKKLWTIWKFTFFELTESNINQNKETKKTKNFFSHI